MPLVNHTIYSSSADASPHTVTLVATPTAGRPLLLLASSSGVISTPSGWTLVLRDTGANDVATFTKTASGSETSVSVALSASADLIAHVLEFDDAGSLGGYDFHFGNDGTNATGVSFGSGDATDYYMIGYATNNIPVSARLDTWRAPQSLVGSIILGAGSGFKHMSSLGVGDGVGATNTQMQVGSTAFSGNNVGFLQIHLIKQLVALSVNAGSDFSAYSHAASVISASTVGGTGAKTFAWTKISGGSGSFADSTAASTTFTPNATGTYVLRCTVTDAASTVAHDDISITVTNAPTLVGYASITSDTGWSVTGPDDLTAISDALDTTFLTSSNTPTNVIIDGIANPLTKPGPGLDFTARVRMYKISATTGSLEAKLYVGSTLISTVTVGIPSTLTDVDVIFPASDIAGITESQWATGIRVTLGVTAA